MSASSCFASLLSLPLVGWCRRSVGRRYCTGILLRSTWDLPTLMQMQMNDDHRFISGSLGRPPLPRNPLVTLNNNSSHHFYSTSVRIQSSGSNTSSSLVPSPPSLKASKLLEVCNSLHKRMSLLQDIYTKLRIFDDFAAIQSKRDEETNSNNISSSTTANASTTKKEWTLMNEVSQQVQSFYKLITKVASIFDLAELAQSENDTTLADDCIESILELEYECDEKLQTLYLSGPFDGRNAYVTILAGAGGTDSCDWTSMIFNMYEKWVDQNEERRFDLQVLDKTVDDASKGGYRNISFKLTGASAFGLMKYEAGVHRLVRISPYDSQQKRHTSFAQVLVCPDVSGIDMPMSLKSIVINQQDLDVETKKSSGAGGQHVNTTESAIRITHRPSGIVVQCQNERSQHQNRAVAMDMLRARLFRHEIEKSANLKREFMIGDGNNSWGSQIRSTVLNPYQIVKDHRTGWESANVEDYLNGNDLQSCMNFNLQRIYCKSLNKENE